MPGRHRHTQRERRVYQVWQALRGGGLALEMETIAQESPRAVRWADSIQCKSLCKSDVAGPSVPYCRNVRINIATAPRWGQADDCWMMPEIGRDTSQTWRLRWVRYLGAAKAQWALQDGCGQGGRSPDVDGNGSHCVATHNRGGPMTEVESGARLGDLLVERVPPVGCPLPVARCLGQARY